MLVFSEGFDGAADGVAFTSANSNWTTFSPAGGCVSDTTRKYGGAASGRFDAAGASAQIGVQFTEMTTAKAVWRMRMDSAPSSNTVAMQFRTNGTNALCCEMRIQSTGAIQIRNSSQVSQAISSSIVPAATWVRFEMDAVSGAMTLRYYADAASSTVTETLSGSYATQDVGRFSLGAASTTTWGVNVDTAEVDDGATPPAPVGSAMPFAGILIGG